MTVRELIEELNDLCRIDPTIMDWQVLVNHRDSSDPLDWVERRGARFVVCRERPWLGGGDCADAASGSSTDRVYVLD